MPRKNKHKSISLMPQTYGSTLFDTGFKAGCYGCAFVGQDFKCLTSDGNCLKSRDKTKEADNAAVK